jgi:hypothetical protein
MAGAAGEGQRRWQEGSRVNRTATDQHVERHQQCALPDQIVPKPTIRKRGQGSKRQHFIQISPHPPTHRRAPPDKTRPPPPKQLPHAIIHLHRH